MSIERRLREALHQLMRRLDSADLTGFTAHLGLGAYRELLRELGAGGDGQLVYAGTPVKPNLNLADGEIVLRYEVKA